MKGMLFFFIKICLYESQSSRITLIRRLKRFKIIWNLDIPQLFILAEMLLYHYTYQAIILATFKISRACTSNTHKLSTIGYVNFVGFGLLKKLFDQSNWFQRQYSNDRFNGQSITQHKSHWCANKHDNLFYQIDVLIHYINEW